MAAISITAANAKKSPNASAFANLVIAAAVTITQGQALYQLANTTVGLADANASAPANTFLGFAITAGAAGQPIVYVGIDPAYQTGATTPLTAGDTIYLSSETAGGITNDYSLIAAGSTVIVLGVVNTDLTLNLNPIVGGVKPA